MGRVYVALGYDTEAPYGVRALTKEGHKFLREHLDFIDRLGTLLDGESIPRTHFFLGQHLIATVSATDVDVVREVYLRPLVEVGQHSFSHPVLAEIPGSRAKINIVSVDKYLRDVTVAQELISYLLGVSPLGFRVPVGYPCDLTGLGALDPNLRQSIDFLVSELENIGFEYVSSDLRGRSNSYRGEMVVNRQPHMYPDLKLVEVPSHGYHDNVFVDINKTKVALGMNRPPTQDEIIEFYRVLFNETAALASTREGPTFVGLCLHPQSVMVYDPNLDIHRRKINEARKSGFEFVTYGDIARRIVRGGDF